MHVHKKMMKMTDQPCRNSTWTKPSSSCSLDTRAASDPITSEVHSAESSCNVQSVRMKCHEEEAVGEETKPVVGTASEEVEAAQEAAAEDVEAAVEDEDQGERMVWLLSQGEYLCRMRAINPAGDMHFKTYEKQSVIGQDTCIDIAHSIDLQVKPACCLLVRISLMVTAVDTRSVALRESILMAKTYIVFRRTKCWNKMH